MSINEEEAVLDDPENDEEVQDVESAVWEIDVQEIPKAPKDGDKPEAGEKGKKTTTTTILWKLRKPEDIPQPASQAPAYVPLPLGLPYEWVPESKPPYFLQVVDWDSLRRLASNTTPTTQRIWNSKGAKNETARTLTVLDKEGKLIQVKLPKQKMNHNWIANFDAWFSQAQTKAGEVKADIPTGYQKWKAIEYKWKQHVGGDYREGDDKRNFTDADGYAFTLNGIDVDLDNELRTDARYVRLRKSPQGRAIILEDLNTAEGNETFLDEGGIYISTTTIDKLRGGTYDWQKNSQCVCCRNALGVPTWFSCQQMAMQHSDWWKKAYTSGISAEQSFGSRSRNVEGVELCLSVPKNDKRGVTVESIQQAINHAKKHAATPIKTTAKVVDEDSFWESSTRAGYEYLSTPPFGDFDTWIKSGDLASYLRSYPGYLPPDTKTIDDFIKAVENLKPKASDKTKNQHDFEKEYAKQTGAPLKPHMTICKVSYETINTASRAGRDSFPQQKELMGESATSLAQSLKWDTGSRIKGVTDPVANITWDAPGVWASECFTERRIPGAM